GDRRCRFRTSGKRGVQTKALLQFDRNVMEDYRVHAFRSAHIIEWDVNAGTRHLAKFSSTKTRDADRVKAVVIRPTNGLDDVWTVTGYGNRDDKIACLRKGLQLLFEYCMVPIVVAIRCHQGNVVAQRDRTETLR